jgi:predicted Zn-dependent protease
MSRMKIRASGTAGVLVGGLALALLGACAGMGISGEGLVNIGAAAMPIGPEKEREIGFGIAATVAGRYELADAPELTRYLNLVGHAVAQQSIRRDEVEFRFGVLDTDDVNAFAAPGGFILVTRGALALMETEADLAGVLAHEVAHVDQKHVLDEIRRSSVMKTASDEAQLSGALLDAIAELGTSMLFTGLSREDEMEADSLGLLYATATGYRPGGLASFLRRLIEAEGGEETGMAEWTATHPSTTERLRVLEAHMTRAGIDPESGQAVRERFRSHVLPGGT